MFHLKDTRNQIGAVTPCLHWNPLRICQELGRDLIPRGISSESDEITGIDVSAHDGHGVLIASLHIAGTSGEASGKDNVLPGCCNIPLPQQVTASGTVHASAQRGLIEVIILQPL